MGSPFSRSAAIFAAITAAISAGMSRSFALENIGGTYVSRGHGLGKHSGKKWGASSGKYTQVLNGKRECERRVRQIARSRAATSLTH